MSSLKPFIVYDPDEDFPIEMTGEEEGFEDIKCYVKADSTLINKLKGKLFCRCQPVKLGVFFEN